ncbi:unnamed protein product [Dicrocoelium dendriticum]|nr:unnamed protein product [Dicrocoelium dendriticum]
MRRVERTLMNLSIGLLVFVYFFRFQQAVTSLRWNKYVNPFYNVTHPTTEMISHQRLPSSGDISHRFSKRLTLKNFAAYPNSVQREVSFMEASHLQMDPGHPPQSTAWTPYAIQRTRPPAQIDTKSFQKSGLYGEKPFRSHSSDHLKDMVWNEEGQFWGYRPQRDEYEHMGDQFLWPYDAGPRMESDASCIPPFCIPIDCAEPSEPRCRNRKILVSCTGSNCLGNCSSPQTCGQNITCSDGLSGAECHVMNRSVCLERYGAQCIFGCIHTGITYQCVCNPWSSAANNTSCFSIDLDLFQCPLGCNGRGRCDMRSKECRCEPGFSGLACEHTQVCPQGLTGSDCRLDIDECLSGAAGCEQRCVNLYGSFRCECLPGYRVDPINHRKCEPSEQCSHRCAADQGTCDVHDRCICNHGFQGEWCTEDVNECEQNLHNCEHICVNTRGSFECQCYPGYKQSPQNETMCIPVDCDPKCVPTQGTCGPDGTCVCFPGFEGPDCGLDVDECTIGKDQCEHHCVNTPGSYYCVCEVGYLLDPVNRVRCLADTCDPSCANAEAECYRRRCINGVCRVVYINATQRTQCECDPGFQGTRCEEDIDECTTHTNKCDQLCRNTHGSYSCDCMPGYRLGPDGFSCFPVNKFCHPECMNGGECLPDGQCACQPNFEGPRCEFEVNLCQKLKNCEHHCVTEKDGTSRCLCRPGYQLAEDGRSCKLSEECVQPCQNGGQCFRGQCLCKSGFEGLHCERDKDECALPAAVHGCTYECRNTFGSYECVCPDGYNRLADKRTCVRSHTGAECSPVCRNGGVCKERNRCECLRGYKGPDCGTKVNECEEYKPCDPNYAECRNTPGGFECVCHPGYRLMVDGRHCIEEARTRHAPHLVFRGRGQKGIVVANRVQASAPAVGRQTVRRKRRTAEALKHLRAGEYRNPRRLHKANRRAALKGDPEKTRTKRGRILSFTVFRSG